LAQAQLQATAGLMRRVCFWRRWRQDPVYRLLGKKDLGTTQFPAIETALVDGELAFRQHSAGHTAAPNWPTFLKYAERHLTSQAMRDGQ
jgi:hypothetical protein